MFRKETIRSEVVKLGLSGQDSSPGIWKGANRHGSFFIKKDALPPSRNTSAEKHDTVVHVFGNSIKGGRRLAKKLSRGLRNKKYHYEEKGRAQHILFFGDQSRVQSSDEG